MKSIIDILQHGSYTTKPEELAVVRAAVRGGKKSFAEANSAGLSGKKIDKLWSKALRAGRRAAAAQRAATYRREFGAIMNSLARADFADEAAAKGITPMQLVEEKLR